MWQEPWATMKKQEKRIEVSEMRMLQWVWNDMQTEDQERTHMRNNESGTGFKKDHGETIESVQACDEKRSRTHTEKSVENGCTREKNLFSVSLMFLPSVHR